MKTYALYIVPSDPAYDTNIVGVSILYSDGLRRGYWKTEDTHKAIAVLIQHNQDEYLNTINKEG